MQKPPGQQRIDERLSSLLETEQRLEARFREVEAEARAQVEAARRALTGAREDGLRSIEALAGEEERAELAAHQAALRALEQEGEAALTKLSAVGAEVIDRLARKVLERVIAVPTQRGGAS